MGEELVGVVGEEQAARTPRHRIVRMDLFIVGQGEFSLAKNSGRYECFFKG